ncbi:MAG: hypothetical protein QF745_08470, partial [Planctomycetota bacterium]|nr:hypothetical protein [Planctomycetota bacterium]
MVVIPMIVAGVMFVLPAPLQDWSEKFKDGTTKSTKTCCDGRNPLPWKEYNQGIEWIESNDRAFEQAKKEK